MHVLANIRVKPSENYLTGELIPFFTDFTLLFMVVSGFSLCCGYYRRVKEGAITPAAFYKKRYMRILPFFALLCLVDLAVSPSWGAACEAFANVTLCFGLLPPDVEIGVIGVGWFLGVVFLFVFVSMAHVGAPGRKCMVFCAPLFIAGGLAYLYRGRLAAFGGAHKAASAAVVVAATACYFAFRAYIPAGFAAYAGELSLFSLWLAYAVGSSDCVLNNRVAKYVSGISMEVYLAHMVVYRVVEKLRLEDFIGQRDALYAVVSLLTLLGAVCFAHVVKYWVVDKAMARVAR